MLTNHQALLTRRSLSSLAIATGMSTIFHQRAEAQLPLPLIAAEAPLVYDVFVGVVGSVIGTVVFNWLFGKPAEETTSHGPQSAPIASPYRVPSFAPDIPPKPLTRLDRLAARLGNRMDLAARVATLIGPSQTQSVIDGKLGLWLQPDKLEGAHNELIVQMFNKSERTYYSQIQYEIYDVSTKKREFTLIDDGYRIDPKGAIEYSMNVDLQFPKPGPKRISIIEQPQEISFRSRDILVV
jgi:hypothetical protein